MRKLAALVVFALAFVVLSASPSAATTGPNSAGYIYHFGEAGAGKLMRYNIVEGVDEPISTADPSCAGLSLNNASDQEVDAVHQYIYWVSGASRLARMNLMTGVCQEISQNTGHNSNGLWALWRGLTILPQKNLLFFVDNQAYPNATDPANKTIHWIDLSALPATGAIPASVDNILPLEMAPGEESEVNFAGDITIDGDYAYIGARNREGINQSAIPAGTAIYRVRIFDAATHDLVTTAYSEKVYKLVTPMTTDAQIMTIEFHNGLLYYSAFDWHIGGISVVDLSGYTPGNPVTTARFLIDNYSSNMGALNLGFAFGQNDVVFTSDQPNWPLPRKMIYVDGSVNAPVVTGGTELEAFVDDYQFGQLDWNLGGGPAAPVLSAPVRSSDNAGTFAYTVSDSAPSAEFAYIATGSDSTTVTGTCSASPCSLTGLTAGVTYSVAMRQRWMNGSTEIMHSLASNAVTVPLPTVTPPPAAGGSAVAGGFASGSAVIPAATKAAIRTFVAGHSSSNVVDCTGYVANNANSTTAALKQLAVNRATAVCNYVQTLNSSITVGKLNGVVTSAAYAKSHQVVIGLRSAHAKTVTGFVTFKSDLSASAKSGLRAFVQANSGSTTATCVGYVGNNWKGVSQKALEALALARAKAACNFVHSVDSSIKIGKLSIVTSNSKQAGIRKVSVVLH